MMRFYFILFIFLPLLASAQKIHYEFAAPNAAHHEAEITVTVTGLNPAPVFFRMSRSSPGRYATHEFGKNVYNVSAVDGNGKTLVVEKTDADVYKVVTQQGTVKLKYTLYGNYADGTYASIDASAYHLNMPATFMWVKGLEKVPLTLQFRGVNKNWKIATQLKPSSDPYTFTAPNLQYFMDAPTKLANLHMREWKLVNPDQKQYTIRLALDADAPDEAIDTFTHKLQKIVKEAQAVYGELPAFDYGTYTFISSITPYVVGDGMEHRNSTMITDRAEFSNDNEFLRTFAHEFFHCWNVERIRPKSLEPFNFEKSNMSEALWIAEGFTQYYGSLLMKRAGLMSDEEFYSQMSGLINAKENTPGGRYYTPVENSQRAVFVDAGVSVDETNYPNMFTTYYYYGGALALALDLQLKRQFGKSLDGFMQQLWMMFGKQEKPYSLSGVQQVLASNTTTAFASDFFKNQVYGHEPVNYGGLLQLAGMELKKPYKGRAWIGNVQFAISDTQLKLASNTIRNTPLYKAGVDIDDEILQLGTMKLKQPKDLETELSKYKPGETIKLIYKHRGMIIEKQVVIEENPFVTIVPMESPGSSISTIQKEFKQNWLGSKATNDF
jgi:predicted metalloprotease with PDZ domain